MYAVIISTPSGDHPCGRMTHVVYVGFQRARSCGAAGDRALRVFRRHVRACGLHYGRRQVVVELVVFLDPAGSCHLVSGGIYELRRTAGRDVLQVCFC